MNNLPEVNGSPGALTRVEQHTSGQKITMSREMQEVQASIMLARTMPRDMAAVEERVLKACERIGLAEKACYSFPRGSETVTGPSIRLAETIAQNYGNFSFGIREVSQGDGESVVQAYAWDMETNTRQEKIFTVPHIRKTRQGTFTLTDPRDIYELVANNGARRLRSCILGLIPGDIVEAAVLRCERTLERGAGVPLPQRIEKMREAFKTIGVTDDHLKHKLNHPVEKTSEQEIVNMQKIFNSIKDGMSKVEDYFNVPKSGAASLNERLSAKVNE